MTLFLACMLVSFTCECTPFTLSQPYISIFRNASQDKSVSVKCNWKDINLQTQDIYWYLQRPNGEVKRILHAIRETQEFDNGFSDIKFDLDFEKTLTIKSIVEDDSGTYYCAALGGHRIKIFGSGTKLIVGHTARSAEQPKSTILSPSLKEMERTGQGIYLCLLENFFPDVIQVVWKSGDQDIPSEQQEIKGVPDKDGNTLYSVTSWITVSKNDIGKRFTCRYKHEGISKFENWDEISVAESKPPKVVPGSEKKEETCPAGDTGDTMNYPNPSSQRAAYLTYLLLITKSALYGPIMFFIIYRTKILFCF
uniref:Ig-like domain-containing protein n=1 Tax=Xenopus tropicalis TaxID=8364 RepID=A0A803K6T4_XENTR